MAYERYSGKPILIYEPDAAKIDGVMEQIAALGGEHGHINAFFCQSPIAVRRAWNLKPDVIYAGASNADDVSRIKEMLYHSPESTVIAFAERGLVTSMFESTNITVFRRDDMGRSLQRAFVPAKSEVHANGK
ncbi:MAG: hypothetical protein OXR66_01270 [Candidatus Woesearchaeota archaeon]|nr:hypothetical protein [Candidatus Woesearchaeota archaeon]